MMKKLLSIVLIISLLTLSLASCKKDDEKNNNEENKACEHTYSEAWSSNSNEHWHKATCEHSDLKTGVAAHTDSNEDGECDVCGYFAEHFHTFADTWSTDETHHWKNATCTHTAEKGELGEHVDANEDGACDSCSYHVHVVGINGKCVFCGEQIVGGGTQEEHKHTYSDEWSSDANKHWHAATCTHTDLKIDIKIHTDADEDGDCDVCDYMVGHDHTFSEGWSSDETHHWKSATCTHTGEKDKLAPHTDEDGNKKCDTCDADYEVKEEKPCEHTYSDEWSSNSTDHWHAATCEHVELKDKVESHTDTDENGKCDVCSYAVGHTHTYSTEWSSDEDSHWRVATCTHKDAIGYLGAHRDSDTDGKCDDCLAHVHAVDEFTGECKFCGEKVADVDTTGLGYVVHFLASKANNITGGSIKYFNQCTSVSEGNFTVSTKHDIEYILGNNAAYYKMVTIAGDNDQYRSTIEKWYERTNGEIFGVYKESGVDEFYVDSAIANNLVGHYYAVSTLASAYGAENILIELYRLSQMPQASSYVYLPDHDSGNYSFSFCYVSIDYDTAAGEDARVDYYEVEVSFSVSESGALIGLDLLCKCYTNFAELEEDRDYTYDYSTGVLTLKEDAVADTYSFVVTQTEGERAYVSEHPKSEFVPTDFNIYSDEECTEEVNEIYYAKVGSVFFLYLGGFTPEGTSASFVPEAFVASCDSSNVFCSVNPISSSIILNVRVAGTYTLTVSVFDTVKTVKLTTDATVKLEIGDSTVDNVSVEITDNNAWTDLVTFTAAEDGDYTFTIAPGVYLGAKDDSTIWADFNVTDESEDPKPIGGSITVSLKAGESYSFYVMAQVKNAVAHIPYTVAPYTGK